MKKLINLFFICALFAPAIALAGFNIVQNDDGSTAWEGGQATDVFGTEVWKIDKSGNIDMSDATNADREIPWINLGAAYIDGSGPATASTAPGWATFGNVSGIEYASQSEATAIQASGAYPAWCDGDLVIKALVGSDGADAAGVQSLDWAIWVNGDGVAYDAARIEQGAVVNTNDSMDTSPEIFTLTMDATGQAAISAGSALTIDIFNAGTSSNKTVILDLYGTCSAKF